jgi:hypothetical protein
LHTRPDLLERLEELAPDGIPIIPLFGVPALAFDGLVAVVALENRFAMIRSPELPDGTAPERPITPLTDHGRQTVSVWQSEMPHRGLTETS